MMDTDSSSEEHSSSECSTDSSDDDKLETVQASGSPVDIPQGLCEKREIFDEFFSVQTWNMLSEGNRQHLRKFLPKFPENDEQEKNVTLQRLFNGNVFKFTSPLDNFYEHLKAGHYRPDIAKMRYLIRKAERKESIWRYKKHKEKLEAELVESRRSLLGQVSSLPPGAEPRLPKPTTSNGTNPIVQRTKRRYFQILGSVRSRVNESGFSSDDNYPDGAPQPVSRKQKRHLNALKNSHVLNGERVIIATTATKSAGLDLEKNLAPNHNPYVITEQTYKDLLLQHKKRKFDSPEDQELDTKGKVLTDIVHRARLNYNKKLNKPEVKISRKKVKKEMSPECSSDSDSDSTVDPAVPVKSRTKKVIKPASPKPIPVPVIKQEIKTEEISPVIEQVKPTYNQYTKITPATLSDLDGIDMMNIPIDLDDSNIDILDINSKAELMQDTHANFLALIRDIICSTGEHRMDMNSLEERLRTWQENPITALNDWYCMADNWTSQLPSAINFLSGNFPEQPDDFVPYIEYKPILNVYQWIGAGRDSDNSLTPLFQYWLERRNDMKPTVAVKEKEEVDLEVVDRSQTPPPPRCPTNWTVRKADLEEIKAYREQERRRYDNPHKAFTYRCNGYESVVGPLKGIYNPSAGNTKARGHTMLSADRPNFVTILSLVRDATARLPNGEGTRAEICELLKCSQYISSTAPDNVLQSVVSGALDRMHTQFDPCVKYDPKRKIWIYLHRNRSEEDFERIHQQYQGMNKNAKKPTKQKTPTKPKPKAEKVIKNNVKPPSETSQKSQDTKQTSLLLPQNQTKSETSHEEQPQKKPQKAVRQVSQEEKEINEALQAIVQNNTGKPKGGKSLVKIIASNQGKSLIIPSSANAVVKTENRVVTPKVSQAPIVTQQLLQSLAQQKQVGQQQLIRVEVPEAAKDPKKTNISIQQQFLQSISPQQLQNIKNVTLLRNVRHASPQNTQSQPTIVLTNDDQNSKTPVISIPETKVEKVETSQPIRVQHSALTLSQQQQLLQSIRQKGVQNVGNQQQVLIRHKAPVLQKTMQAAPGTSLLGQTRVVTADSITTKPIMTTGQGPLVAKVLTNAAGQVISVESLLAHQKQHGSLPQGTTLRVSGVKGGTNIIQLATPTNKASMTQVVASGTQNNFITLTSQPKLVLSSTAPTSTIATSVGAPSKASAKSSAKSQGVSKFPPKVTQQIINAKFITQSVDTQKLMQPKVIIGQNQLKLGNKGVQPSKPVTLAATNSNSIRMVNAANLNLAHLSGKPVLLAGKGSTLTNIQGQNVIIQTQANTSSGLVALTTTKNNTIQTQNVISQGGQVMLAPQIKMQPQVLLSSGVKGAGLVQNQTVSTGQIIVGGHPVRLQTSTANPQRVVLASQGQGGQIVAQQILLPAGFQGTAINIKSLQGVKVIPIAQAQQTKGVQGRQVFARVMAPSSIVRTASVSATDVTNTTPTTE